ncbi:MAG: hypothetical protein ACK4ME_01520 [Fimbriimonadales bacterium]
MKRLLALIVICTMIAVGATQQQNKAPQQEPPKQQPPKPGVFTVQGKPLNFFARGKGTLTVRARGYLIVNTVKGAMQVEGFQEVNELPRNVRLKPPLNQRIKVYKGQGVLRIQGDFDSVRAVLREGQVNFSGVAAFNLSGVGEASVDGVKRSLTPTGAFTLLVPEPRFQQEDDVKPRTPKEDR